MGVERVGEKWVAKCEEESCGWSKEYKKDYLAKRGLQGHRSGHRAPTPTPSHEEEPAPPVVIMDERGMLEDYITEVWVSAHAKKKVAGVLRLMEHAGWYDLSALRWGLSKAGCPAGDLELIMENWYSYIVRCGDIAKASGYSGRLASAKKIDDSEYEVEREIHRLERFEARQAIIERVRNGGTSENLANAIKVLTECVERLEQEISDLRAQLRSATLRTRIEP
jgi:hypothetical protein